MPDYPGLTERYRSAYYGGDFESLRELLIDDFTFARPAATFRGIASFLKASNHVPLMVKSVETLAVFCERNEVCAILTLAVSHQLKRFPIVEWYRFEGDRIASIQTSFDTGPSREGLRKTRKTAVDPVCHMSVNKNAPAARREYDGGTYYFCSEGCAIAFTEDPPRYLAATRNEP